MYKRPRFGELRFSCPHCGALAHQYWYSIQAHALGKDERPARIDAEQITKIFTEAKKQEEYSEERNKLTKLEAEFRRAETNEVFLSSSRKNEYSRFLYNLEASRCDSCDEISIWLQEKMIYPSSSPTGRADPEMPKEVRDLYDEASAVFFSSPRAAAALLRLSLQLLLIHLGQAGKNINQEINNLIADGKLQDRHARMMHAVRIVGNDSVHPGEIDVNDDSEIAEALFGWINRLVEELIVMPKKDSELWNRLPRLKREAAEAQMQQAKTKANGQK